MGWVKIDDGFFRHPKAIAAGRDGRMLFIASICYSGAGLTDGFVPAGALALLGAETGVTKPTAAAAMLVAVGLWEEVEGGYQVHDYLDYNSSSGKVRADKEAARERMQRKRSEVVRANNERSSPEVRIPDTDIDTDTDTERSYEPNGSTERSDLPLPLPKRSGYSAEFEAWFADYPPGRGSKKQAYDLWKRLTVEERQSAVDTLPRFKAGDDWKRGYHPAPEVWLRGKRWENPPPEAVDEGRAMYAAFLAGADAPPPLGARR